MRLRQVLMHAGYYIRDFANHNCDYMVVANPRSKSDPRPTHWGISGWEYRLDLEVRDGLPVIVVTGHHKAICPHGQTKFVPAYGTRELVPWTDADEKAHPAQPGATKLQVVR